MANEHGTKRSIEHRNERTALARLAAHSLHAKHDSVQLTKAARAAFLSRFEHKVDPEGTLESGERARRAAHAKKAYFIRLGIESGKARRNAAA